MKYPVELENIIGSCFLNLSGTCVQIKADVELAMFLDVPDIGS